MARKPRNSKAPEITFTRPINIRDFGDPEKDPCFGKLLDLTTLECQSCGDVELCQIATMVNFKREVNESPGKPYLDVTFGEEELVRNVREYIKEKLDKGIRKELVYKRTLKKFKISNDLLNKIILDGHTGFKQD